MLYREIIAVCSQIHTKHINTLCGQNVEFGNIKRGGTKSNHPALRAYGSRKMFHTYYHQFYIRRWIIRYSSPSNVKLNKTLPDRHFILHSTRNCLNERSIFITIYIVTHTHTHSHTHTNTHKQTHTHTHIHTHTHTHTHTILGPYFEWR